MSEQDIINYIIHSSSNMNWKILEDMIFRWKGKEIDKTSERLVGLLYLNKIKKYVLKNSEYINPIVLKQLLSEVEEVVEVSSDYIPFYFNQSQGSL